MSRKASRRDFSVPVTNGNYAEEVLYLKPVSRSSVAGALDHVKEFTLDVESLPTGASIEVDILRAGGDASTAGDWNLARVTHNTTGLKDPVFLSEWYGVRVRARSGGTAGSAIVNVAWL